MNKKLGMLASIHYGKSPAEVLDGDGFYPVIGTGGVYGQSVRSMFASAVVVPRKGSLGNPQLLETPFWPVDTTYAVIPNTGIDLRWLFYSLLNFDLTKLNEATGVPSISRDWLSKIKLYVPDHSHQQKIATILQTIDQTIEKTEALIEKYQQIKAGLMHDLFTCGITADGKLRSPREQAPELYQETPIGWIPKEWEYETIDLIKESLVDGPFGSNLKTEHYVIDPGVRVVRLQNIQATNYNDNDKAFVSEKHANSLLRNKVVGGDILIAGLGEERYPVGRACIYPSSLPHAINKADCFRLRCNQHKMINSFMMLFLNTSAARNQIIKYEQGVTRPRINLGNMKRLLAPKPMLDEQLVITKRIENLNRIIEIERVKLTKLNKQKSGLMHDLLTGKVAVNIDETEDAANV